MTPDEVVKVLELEKEVLIELMKNGEFSVHHKNRVDKNIEAFSTALALIQDYQKLRRNFDGLGKFLNDWLSKRHGIKYNGVLSRDLAQAIITYL